MSNRNELIHTSQRSLYELKKAQKLELLGKQEQKRLEPFKVLEDHNTNMRNVFKEFVEGGNTWIETNDSQNQNVQGRLVVLENPADHKIVATCLLTYVDYLDKRANDGEAEFRFAFIDPSYLDHVLKNQGYPFEGIPSGHILTGPVDRILPQGDLSQTGNYFTEPASVTLFGADPESFDYSVYQDALVDGLQKTEESQRNLSRAQIASANHIYNPHLDRQIRKFDPLDEDKMELLTSDANANGGFAV